MWQLKLLKNAVIGLFPVNVQQKARKLKRKISPHKLEVNRLTLDQGLQQIQLLRSQGFDPSGKHLLELGTGWAPIIPLLFYLAGCEKLTLFDMQRLLDELTFQETCKQLLRYRDEIANKIGLDTPYVGDALATLSSMPLGEALIFMNCSYHAPEDILHNCLPDRSVDVITSRAVLEHVPPQIVKEILCEFSRLLGKDGVMCHIIDNSDHWQHHDKTINRVNFLKFSPKVASLISAMNPLDYQNRLRHSQYRELIETSGFKILFDESPPDNETLKDLPTFPIHPSFNGFAREDLAILTSYFVAVSQ